MSSYQREYDDYGMWTGTWIKLSQSASFNNRYSQHGRQGMSFTYCYPLEIMDFKTLELPVRIREIQWQVEE